MKRCIHLLLSLLYANILWAQTITNPNTIIKLDKQFGINKLAFTYRNCRFEENRNMFRGIASDLDTSAILVYDTHYKQRIYQGFINSNSDKKLEKQFVSIKKDSNSLSKKIIKQGVSFLVGYRKNQKIIICDTNNNLDFSDDQVMSFDTLTANKYKLAETLPANYEYYDGKKIITHSILIRISPFVNDEDIALNERKMQITVGLFEHQLGYFFLDNIEYKIALNNYFDLNGTFKNSNIAIAKRYEDFKLKHPLLKPNQVVEIAGKYLKINDLSTFGDSLRISVVPIDSAFGNSAGSFLPFSKVQTVENKLINFIDTDKDYILLDFWGTWCAPCLKDLPLLKAFSEKFKDKVKIIGIAYDNDIELVKKVVREKNIGWDNVFIDRDSGASDNKNFVNMLRIECYPSFILIDKKSKILANECSSTGLKRIENIVNFN